MPDSDKLTPSESALLIVLLAEAREISNAELRERFGLTLTGDSRRKLNRLGLVESWQDKRNRPFNHRLADKGWARCQEPLNFENSRPRALGAALASLMGAVHRDLERTHRSLAQAFAPELTGAAPTRRDRPETGSARLELPRRIREVYQTVAPAPRAWVSLVDIRRKLGDVSREDVDAALRELEREPDVNIVPESNQKTLTDEDWQAAVIIGGQRKHVIAIGV